MACEEIQAKVQTLVRQQADLQKQMMEEPPAERAQVQSALKKLGERIWAAQTELSHCLDSLKPQKLSGPQPAGILEVAHFNNPPGFEPGADWAPGIANGEFPVHSGLEWKQVLDSDDEYDEFNPVGASGWLINPRIANSDVPFNHPFGRDWEFEYALDPGFNFLLARGNSIPEVEQASAESFAIAADNHLMQPDTGLLGVEIDSGLVPPLFQALTSSLDRIAVFGRWIVDTGHNDDAHPYRAEIHPPLLMASASVYQRTDGTQFTRTLLTSRPYLVGQTFGRDTAKLYQDGVDDDGHLFEHTGKEVARAFNPLESVLVEAHPKIKSHPFRGVHVLQLVVRTPQPRPAPTMPSGVIWLSVSFHFTVRNGCTVQVLANDEGSVRVMIVLNSAGYTPAPLPHRNGHRISLDELNELNKDAGFWSRLVTGVAATIDPEAAAVLSRGVETDLYDPLPSIDLLSTQDSAAVAVEQLAAGIGLTQDDTQPYPVYGWIDLGWVESLNVTDAKWNP
jgi:hypothetical protein